MVEDFQTSFLPYIFKVVAVVAVYTFLIINVVAEQDIGIKHLDLYFPLFGCFKVVFFVGWLKAALAMENFVPSSDLCARLDRHYSVCEALLQPDLQLLQ